MDSAENSTLASISMDLGKLDDPGGDKAQKQLSSLISII